MILLIEILNRDNLPISRTFLPVKLKLL